MRGRSSRFSWPVATGNGERGNALYLAYLGEGYTIPHSGRVGLLRIDGGVT